MNIPLMFRRFRLKHFLLAILVFTTSGRAQWTTNPLVNTPVGISLNEEQNPAMVSDGAGGAIVVWEEDRGVSTGVDIIAQRIDAVGNPRWGSAGVLISSETGAQRFPKIIADESGGAIITWYDGRGIDTDIYAQRVNSSGVVQWPVGGVPLCLALGHQWDPVIASDGADGAIVTWYEARYDTAADIFAQRINGAGVVQWAVDGVPLCAAINGQVTPAIATDNAGGAIVVWLDFRNGVVELFSQRVDQSGTALWDTNGVRLCDASGFQYSPSIIGDGAGGAIVTWNDFRSGFSSDIYAQRMSGTGVRQWSTAGASVCMAADYQYAPRIVSDKASGAIICWYDYRGGNSDIYAQRISPTGGPLWNLDGVVLCNALNDQQFPAITQDGRGGAFVGWQDTRNGPNADIFAQQVNDLGITGFQLNGIVVSVAVNGQQFPRLIGNSSGGAILVWGDRRTGLQQDIYAQRIVLANADASFGYWAGGVVQTTEAVSAYAGVDQGAFDGQDPRDIPEPLVLPAEYVSVTSVSPTAFRFVQDVKQEAPELAHTAKRWSLQSRTSATNMAVNLIFTEDRLPSQFTPVLYDGASGSYRDLRSEPVYSYTSPAVSGEPRELLLLLGDSTKPSISISTPNGGEVLVTGIPHTITWNSSDSSGVLRHYLYYTITGGPPYDFIDSTSGQSTSYVWTPVDASMSALLRIVTIDSVLNSHADTSDAFFTIVSGDSVSYTTHTGWNMIGIPVLQTDMTPSGVFSDDFGVTPISVYGFHPVNGYIVPDTLRLGAGYWLKAPPAGVIDAMGSAQESLAYPLQLGWNMFGNPFPAPLSKSLLRFTDGVTIKTMNQAHSAGWLVDVVYGFNGLAYFQENTSLAVWNGYWLRILMPGLSIIFDLNSFVARNSTGSGPDNVAGKWPKRVDLQRMTTR